MIEPEINLIALFCYGSNNNEQVRRRVENPNLISRPCILPFFRRIFAGNVQGWNGGVASLVHMNEPGIACRGSYVFVTEEELKRMDKFEGIHSNNPYDRDPSKNIYRRQNVKIKLSNGKMMNAIAYIKNDNRWIAYPSDAYLNACYRNIYPFWPSLDGDNSLMIYDSNGTLHGIYTK